MVNFMSYLQGAHTWLSFQAGMQCGPSHHIPWCLGSRLSFLPWSRMRGIHLSNCLEARTPGAVGTGGSGHPWPAPPGSAHQASSSQVNFYLAQKHRGPSVNLPAKRTHSRN